MITLILYSTLVLIASIILWKGITLISKKIIFPQVTSRLLNKDLNRKKSLTNNLSGLINTKLNNLTGELEEKLFQQTETDINGKIIYYYFILI